MVDRRYFFLGRVFLFFYGWNCQTSFCNPSWTSFYITLHLHHCNYGCSIYALAVAEVTSLALKSFFLHLKQFSTDRFPPLFRKGKKEVEGQTGYASIVCVYSSHVDGRCFLFCYLYAFSNGTRMYSFEV